MVAQNPTMAVRPGQNACQNSPSRRPPGTKAEGADSMSPKPPARSQAHANKAAAKNIRKGAAKVSSQRMDSVPFTMKTNCKAQKARKHISWARSMSMNGRAAPVKTPPVIALRIW